MQAELIPTTKGRKPGANGHQGESRHHTMAVADALNAEARLYDRLLSVLQPDPGEKDFLEELNPEGLKVVTAYVEPPVVSARGDQKFQFERHGYFVADRKDHLSLLPSRGEGGPDWRG